MNVAAAPSFNPLTGWTTDPLHGVWASDPLWTPPADGGAVSSWRNGGSVGGDLVQATGSKQPTYDASNPAYNNQPVVTFDGTDDGLYVNPADVAQPWWSVVIGSIDAATATRAFVGHGTNSGYRLGTDSTTGAQWRFVPGTGISGGTTDTSPHLFVAKAAGASGALAVDGTSVATGAVGTNAMTAWSIGAGNDGTGNLAAFLDGNVAYAAVFDTDPTALPEWATFTAWVTSTYGITVAP